MSTRCDIYLRKAVIQQACANCKAGLVLILNLTLSCFQDANSQGEIQCIGSPG